MQVQGLDRVGDGPARGARTRARVPWDLEPDDHGSGTRFPAVLARLESLIDVYESGSVALSSPVPPATTR